jgi:hypothetical protein
MFWGVGPSMPVRYDLETSSFTWLLKIPLDRSRNSFHTSIKIACNKMGGG